MHKAVTRCIEAKKLVSHRRQSNYRQLLSPNCFTKQWIITLKTPLLIYTSSHFENGQDVMTPHQGFFSNFLMGGLQIFHPRRGPSQMGGGGLAKKIRLKPKLPT